MVCGIAVKDLKETLTLAADRFRDEIRKSDGERSDERLVQGIQVILETKEALDSNVNQKLALSRLTMRMVKLFSMESAQR